MAAQNEGQAPLRIGETLALALYFCGKNYLPIVGILIQYLILVFGVVFVMALLGLQENAIEALGGIAGSLAGVPIMISIHRGIILQEPVASAMYFPSFLHRRTWRWYGYALLWMLVLGIGSMAAFAVGNYAQNLTEIGFLIPMIGFLGLAVYLYGFGFVFPAVAADEFQSLTNSRMLMYGSMWRVFWCLFIVLLPFNIFQVFSKEVQIDATWVIIGGVISLIFVPLCAAVISIAYKKASTRNDINRPLDMDGA